MLLLSEKERNFMAVQFQPSPPPIRTYDTAPAATAERQTPVLTRSIPIERAVQGRMMPGDALSVQRCQEQAQRDIQEAETILNAPHGSQKKLASNIPVQEGIIFPGVWIPEGASLRDLHGRVTEELDILNCRLRAIPSRGLNPQERTQVNLLLKTRIQVIRRRFVEANKTFKTQKRRITAARSILAIRIT